MKGSKGHELEADVPAAELWKIYGTLRFVELVHELLPQVLHQVEVVRGDGGAGTIIKVTFPPGEEILERPPLNLVNFHALLHPDDVDGYAKKNTATLFYPLAREPGPQSYKEEFVKIDNENRVKEATAIEGDILNLGFITYLTRFEIVEKGPGSSVIRSTVEYEYDGGRPELDAAASTAPLGAAAERLVQYVKEQKTAQASA